MQTSTIKLSVIFTKQYLKRKQLTGEEVADIQSSFIIRKSKKTKFELDILKIFLRISSKGNYYLSKKDYTKAIEFFQKVPII